MPPNMEEAVKSEDQRKNQSQYARLATSFLAKGKKTSTRYSVLELGADCGLLANSISMLADTSDWHYSAIEPNLSVINNLEKTLAKTYRDYIIYSDIDQMINKGPSRLFDIIAAVHVFDHVFSIESLLCRLKKLLQPDGLIFFVVHNPESVIARMLGTRWPPYCAQHPQLYTVKGVKSLASIVGLKVAASGRTTNYFTLKMIGDFMGLSSPLLDKIPISAPLGNRYYILTQKGDACQ